MFKKLFLLSLVALFSACSVEKTAESLTKSLTGNALTPPTWLQGTWENSTTANNTITTYQLKITSSSVQYTKDGATTYATYSKSDKAVVSTDSEYSFTEQLLGEPYKFVKNGDKIKFTYNNTTEREFTKK
jgi:hypothetical protein